jgi:hypothetical protein
MTQQRVRGRAPLGVVDGPEPVDDRERERMAVVVRAPDLAGEGGLAGAAQEGAGQLVGAGQTSFARGVPAVRRGTQPLERRLVAKLLALPAQLARRERSCASPAAGDAAAWACRQSAVAWSPSDAC